MSESVDLKLAANNSTLTNKIDLINKQLEAMDFKNVAMKLDKLDNLERLAHIQDVIIFGVPVNVDEDLLDIVARLYNTLKMDFNSWEFSNIFRMPTKRQTTNVRSNWPVIVLKFLCIAEKGVVAIKFAKIEIWHSTPIIRLSWQRSSLYK